MSNLQQVDQWEREWRNADAPHWGDQIAWATAREIARRLDGIEPAESCGVAAARTNGGWYCTREKGHEGPCAAHPAPPSETA